MKKVLIFSLIFISAFSLRNVSAQIHVDVPHKVEREANYRANKNADELIDKGFDEIENGIKGLFKKKNKKGKQSNSGQETTAANSSNAHSSNNSNSTANSSNPKFNSLDRNAIAGLDDDIVKREIIYLTNHNGIVAGKGSVFVYKTSEGNYGKMEIIDIDKRNNYKTTFRYVTYASDGSVLSQSNRFSVRGTYTCDLDNGTEEGTVDNDVDFQISREDDMNTRLDCYNDAAIALYKGDGQTEEKPKQPKVVWSKYDFVPGQTVIFEDGPSIDEENGEFPSRWDLYQGGAEIAEVDGVPVITFISNGNMYRKGIVPYLKNSSEDYLPDVFTIEFDGYFNPKEYNERYYITLYDRKNQSYSSGLEQIEFFVNSVEFGESSSSLEEKDRSNWDETGGWRHMSIAYTKGKLKVYLDDQRLINIPHMTGNPTGITLSASDNDMYVKNFRIAKGGVKYYNRVMSDGKIVENGIRFDVNKATLKPESMGPINKIYKLMVKHPELKFSVEGHTDSDGDEASNQKLSEARAKAVMDRLISMGISPDRLKSKGWGESKPIDTNATPEGKANNRRVEFVKF